MKNCIEDPVRGPVVELSIIGLFPSEFGKKEQGLIGWIQKIAENIHEYQKALAKEYKH